MLEIIYTAFYWILPACIANATPVVLGGGTPLDFGKKINNKRILGDNKTIRGTFFGVLFGSLTGFVMGRPEIGFLLATGALLGDIVASFFKRRRGVKPSQSIPVLDQLDFVLGAVLLASLLEVPRLEVLVVVFIVASGLQIATNFVSYKLGWKKVWW